MSAAGIGERPTGSAGRVRAHGRLAADIALIRLLVPDYFRQELFRDFSQNNSAPPGRGMPSFNYAVRITRSYDYCQRMVAHWATRCDKILAYEHVGTTTEKIHIHLLIINSVLPVDTLKKQVKTLGASIFKGNGDWSFKTKDAKYGPVTDSQDYVTYMTKGTHDPKYNKGYEPEYLAECKKNWVDNTKTSKLRLEYNAFVRTLQDIEIPKHLSISVSGTVYPGFDIVKNRALRFAYQTYDMICPQSMQMMKSLTLTYCYEREIDYDHKYLWK